MGFLDTVIREASTPLRQGGEPFFEPSMKQELLLPDTLQVSPSPPIERNQKEQQVNSGYANEVDISPDKANRLRQDDHSNTETLETDFLQREYERELMTSNDTLKHFAEQPSLTSHVDVKSHEAFTDAATNSEASAYPMMTPIETRLKTEIMRKSTGSEGASEDNWSDQRTIATDRELPAESGDAPTVRLTGRSTAEAADAATLAYPELTFTKRNTEASLLPSDVIRQPAEKDSQLAPFKAKNEPHSNDLIEHQTKASLRQGLNLATAKEQKRELNNQQQTAISEPLSHSPQPTGDARQANTEQVQQPLYSKQKEQVGSQPFKRKKKSKQLSADEYLFGDNKQPLLQKGAADPSKMPQMAPAKTPLKEPFKESVRQHRRSTPSAVAQHKEAKQDSGVTIGKLNVTILPSQSHQSETEPLADASEYSPTRHFLRHL